MSKVSFRARALDASKPMPVYKDFEIPDMKDFAQINRSVPQMPTGMEKEEETEHHLQRALSAQQVYGSSDVLVIPIPEVHDISKRFHTLYPDTYILSKQYIHVQALGVDQEVPDYDLDSDDDLWLSQQRNKMEITPLKFEEMVDRLEKGCGQQMVTLPEAKLLLKEDDDLILAVYNYWLSKRLKMQQTLISTVKSERRDGTTTKNPYVAFRRRTEKMQTRKNRKNDEVSYEKMLKLRRDLQKTLTLLELLKRREKSKKESLQLTIEVVAKRNEMEDFSGAALTQAEEERAKHPTFVSPFALNGHGEWTQACTGEEVTPVRQHKRRYRKRKQPLQQNQVIPHITIHQFQHQQSNCDVDIMDSSDEDILSPCLSESDHEDKNDPDGMFAFKRRENCYYHQPIYCGLGNWPWHGSEDGGRGDDKFCFPLTSLPTGCMGYARRRIGRGGRVIFDRGDMLWDEAVKQSAHHSNHHPSNIYSDYIVYIRDNKIPWYRPRSHPYEKTHLSAGTSKMQERFGNDERIQGRHPSEFDVESFQSHREQLLDRQQEQQQRLFLERQHDAVIISDLEPALLLGDTGSQFTLDSACAEFAVQALIEPTHLATVSILEGTTPSSVGRAAASPVGSRTGSHQFSFSLVNKSADSAGINVPNNKTILNSQPSTAHRHPDSPMKAELPILASHFLSSPSASLIQKPSSTSSLRQMTSSLQPAVSSNQSVSLTAASLIPLGSLSSSTTFLLSKTNRPLASSTNIRSSGFSSSSASNALQLNFPASSASLITLASSPLLSSLCNPPVITFPSYSTTIPTQAVTTATSAQLPQSTLNNKVTPGCSAANFYKLPVSTTPISDFDMLRPNHEEILFGKDTGIPMDVT